MSAFKASQKLFCFQVKQNSHRTESSHHQPSTPRNQSSHLDVSKMASTPINVPYLQNYLQSLPKHSSWINTWVLAGVLFILLAISSRNLHKGYKTRSFRIGAATNAWDQGKSEDQIAAGAGWSQSVYINTLDATPVTRFFVTVGCISLIIFLFFLFIIGNLYIYQYQCRWQKKIGFYNDHY